MAPARSHVSTARGCRPRAAHALHAVAEHNEGTIVENEDENLAFFDIPTLVVRPSGRVGSATAPDGQRPASQDAIRSS